MSKDGKLDNVLEKVRKAIAEDRFRLTPHAEGRMFQRGIILPEVFYVLKHGYHETSKDEFDSSRRNWRYAIRGCTVDGRDVRVVVSLDKVTRMWIITVIDKDR